jgi:hypothetical protein
MSVVRDDRDARDARDGAYADATACAYADMQIPGVRAYVAM